MRANTTRVPTDKLRQYFDDFTKRHLRDDAPESADIEIMSSELGDQVAARGVHLTGITFNPNTNELDFALANGDHRVYAPREVWTVTEDDGFVRTIEVVGKDNQRDILHISRSE
jgi:hypothetical protein